MMQKKSALVVSSGAAWRKVKSDGVLIRLPSGWVVAVRNVNSASLLVKGVLSDPLSALVYDMVNGDTKKLENMSGEKILAATVALQDAVCKLAFVNPRIVDEPTADDEISLDDVIDADREFVLTLLYTPVQKLADSFREEPEPDVDPMEQGETV
jgi:hypothetical protein